MQVVNNHTRFLCTSEPWQLLFMNANWKSASITQRTMNFHSIEIQEDYKKASIYWRQFSFVLLFQHTKSK